MGCDIAAYSYVLLGFSPDAEMRVDFSFYDDLGSLQFLSIVS